MTNISESPDPIAQLVAKYQSNGHQTVPPEPQPVSQPQRKKSWTGFAGKTFWDWLNLLGVFLIPIVIATASIWFSVQQNLTSLQLSDKQHQSDQTIAVDQQRATTLKTYMDDITGLLLHEGLRESKEDASVRVIARTKTLVALTQLDRERKGTLVQFIHEARLIGYYVYHGKGVKSTKIDAIIDLKIANLNGVSLNRVNLLGASLQGASLRGADLYKANLSRASLEGAILEGTVLEGANLQGAKVTSEQLAKAWTLKDAILPDGSRYPSIGYPIPNHQEPTS